MKNKKNVTFIVIAILFFAYIIVCFKPLSTELQLTPQWSLDITQQTETPETELKVLPFKLGQNAGYFTHEGKIAYFNNFDYKATISDRFMAPYSKNSKEFQVIDTKGNVAAIISEGGFPYISNDKIFVMLPGGSGFEYLDLNGNIISRYLHTSPITAFNSGKNLTIAGYADGTLCTFDKDMNPQYTLTPGGSDIEVILGAGVSSKGNYFACVSGQNNQRFVLYKNENNHAKIVFHRFLKKSIVHQTLVYFSNDESTVYFNDAEGLGIVNLKDFSYSHISMQGTILNIQESPVAESIFVLSKKKELNRNMYTLTILEEKIHKTSSFSFEADSAFILTDENSLFIGKDNKISKLTISKE